MNFVAADVAGATGGSASVVLPGRGQARVKVRNGAPPTGQVELGVRPEQIALTAPDDPNAAFPGAVVVVEHLGSATILYVDTPAGQLIVQGEGNLAVRPGEKVGLSMNEAEVRLLGPTGDAL